jgi:hypothetical protein
MDVEFSPTGEELVSASYDRTVRLWSRMKGHSRDIYHTKASNFQGTFPQIQMSYEPYGSWTSRFPEEALADSEIHIADAESFLGKMDTRCEIYFIWVR